MEKPFAFFDFDGTLVDGDSIVRLLPYARKKGWCGLAQIIRGMWQTVRYKLGKCTVEEAKATSLSFLKGHVEAEVECLARDFCRDVLLPRVRKDALEEIRRLRKEGVEVWLVSASPEFYLKPLCEELHIACLLGTRMNVVDGVYTGEAFGTNCKGIEKPMRIAEMLAARGDLVDYAKSSAYGDSESDWPMLQLAGRKVGVNAKKALRNVLKDADGAEFVTWKG